MFYAAKEFVEKIARRIGHAEGFEQGRRLERERINQAVAAHGIPIPPELAKILADDAP